MVFSRTNIIIFAVLYTLISIVPLQAAEVLVVMWQGKSRAEKGFMEHLKKLRPDIKFSEIDANRDKNRLARKLRKTDLSKVDLVYSFGTTGSKMVKSYLQGKKPQVFNIVLAPVLAKLVNSMEKPGENITGAQFMVPLEVQLDILTKTKKIKKLAVWFDPREKQNPVVLEKINNLMGKHNIEVIPFRIIPDATGFKETLEKAAEKTNKMDAVYFIPSSSFYVHIKELHKHLSPRLLTMGGTRSYVKAGSVMGVAAHPTERGIAAAEQANMILNGKKAGEIPINQITLKNAFLQVNENKKDLLDLDSVRNIGIKIEYVVPQVGK